MSASHHDTSPEFVRAMGAVARELLGEPNGSMSTRQELRWGTHGSMSVHLAKGTWHDHEAGVGGGVLELVQQRQKLDKRAAVQWLRERGHLEAQDAPPSQRRQVATYDYRDEAGALLFQVVRFEPKTFRQRRNNDAGDWIWSLGNTRRVLFRLPETIEAIKTGRTVYLVEGEKAALALAAAGLDATCSPGGAGKWKRDYGAALTGADVVILPDNDQPGRDHAASVAAALHGVAGSVRVLALPDLPDKGDVADWLEAGGTWQQLEELAAEIEPLHDEPEPQHENEVAPAVRATWSDQLEWAEDAIPARQWIAVGYLLRCAVTVLIGPGGASKSTLMIAYAVALALGIECNGLRPLGQFRVALFNAEDDGNEQRRRLSAVLTSLGRKPSDIAGHILRIGPEKVATLLSRHADSGELLPTRAMEELEAELAVFRPDVLILDPLAELHSEDENANVALREVVAEFRSLAKRHNLALVLVHHTRKGPVTPGDMDSGRGASAIASAARIVLTVVGMTPEEEKAFGLASGNRKHHFRLDGGKSNYHTLTDCEWFERQSYTLANGDQVAVPKPWMPPADAVSLDARLTIEQTIAVGSPVGPWSPKLSNDERSIRHLLVQHGINTVAGQRALINDLRTTGFVSAEFKRGNRAKALGIRTPNGEPSNVDWIGAEVSA